MQRSTCWLGNPKSARRKIGRSIGTTIQARDWIDAMRPRGRPMRMRRIASTGSVDDTLLERVNYRNHAQHCGPPPTWCPNKAKCPLGFRSADALRLLKEGLRRSMFPP